MLPSGCVLHMTRRALFLEGGLFFTTIASTQNTKNKKTVTEESDVVSV